ncbi:DUF1838 domain-containing protein [bacterium]|nr:DUF1838 domain-containing protein [bacterium]
MAGNIKNIITSSAVALAATLSVGEMANADSTSLSATDFIKVRCNPTGSPTFTHWHGTVTTSGPGGDNPQVLFKISGFNVARCYADDAQNWTVASRELSFFLDPVSGDVLNSWIQPWSQESLPVVHIANALVQQKIPAVARIPVESLGDTSIARVDVPLNYPNPLASDARFADYSPEPFYKAHESFSYIFSKMDFENIAQLNSVENVQVSWTRVSPWLPWMKMKGAPGYLVFNAIVQRVGSFSELPTLIKDQIGQGLDLFLDAPHCVVAGKANVSSWTYFKKNIDAYLNGSRFPLAAPANLSLGECAQ